MKPKKLDHDALFATNLRKQREKLGLSQRDFAEVLDLSPAYVSYLETKERAPSWEVIKKIAKRLGVEVQELIS